MDKILNRLEKEWRKEAKECEVDIEEQPNQDWNEGFYYGLIRAVEMIRSEITK